MRVEIDIELAEQARAAGISFDEAAELGLRITLAEADRVKASGIVDAHVRQVADAAAAEERALLWARENADAIWIHNARIAERGVFGEDLRRW